ncbi:MAG: hypothetical protein KDD89_00925 [Anaerolineales bacterium]|nr:hypothetical protein [Anaerolineales bacterium]
MPKPTADLVKTGKHLRFFYQRLGAAPNHPNFYAGIRGEYITIEEVSNPVRGGISPINVHDPNSIGRYQRVGSQVEAPEFPTATVQFMQNHGGIPRQLYNLGDCVTTFYQVAGKCQDLSDFGRTNYDYIKIMSDGQVTEQSEGGTSFDGDEGIIDSPNFTFGTVYTVGALNFGEEAATAVTLPVVDVVYGGRLECGVCGPENDGTKLIYALVNNAAGTAPVVVWTNDGGGTWASATITGTDENDAPQAIGIANNKLVVLTNDGTDSSLWVATLNSLSGAPSAFTAVTSGFVSSNVANDMVIESPRSIWFAADNGYIYKSTNVLNGVSVADAGDATTEDYQRVDTRDGVVLLGATNGAVVYSLNQGTTWAATTNDAGSATITAVSVVSANLWMVGSGTTVYYTNTRGETAWSTVVISSGTVNDIVFPTNEVGYVLATESGAGVIYQTIDGLQQWDRDTLTGATTAARLAYPVVSNLAVATNNVTIGGAGASTDGILIQGAATVVG